MNPLIDLTGKTAVVTGGSRGVGAATALLLARAGASVGIGYRSRGAAISVFTPGQRPVTSLVRKRRTHCSRGPTRSSTAWTSSWAITASGRRTPSRSQT